MPHRPWWPPAEQVVAATPDLYHAAPATPWLSWGPSTVCADIASTQPCPPGGCGTIFTQAAGAPQQAAVPTQYPVEHTTPRAPHSVPNHSVPGAPRGVDQGAAGPLLTTSVFLTEASRELLLSLMPPLHPHTAAYQLTLAALQPLAHVMQLPLGAQVTLLLTGLAADSSMQVASASCPAWLPPCTSIFPHIVISFADEAGPEHAERLVAEGICGVSSTYHALSDPLPLVGLLAAQLPDVSPGVPHSVPAFFCADQLLSYLTASQPPTPTPPSGPPAPLDLTPAASVGYPQHDHGVSDASYTQQGYAVSHVSYTEPGVASHEPYQEPQPVYAAPEGPCSPPDSPSSVDGSAQPLDDFELYMQQDTRLITSVVPQGAAAASGAQPGLVPSGNTSHAAQPSAAATTSSTSTSRVVLLSDVGEGDMVALVPLVAPPPGQSFDLDPADVMVQGVIAEVLVDDPLQPQGVLVRLEDDMMGHVAHVISKAYRQTQAAWPTLDTAVTASPAGKQPKLPGRQATQERTPQTSGAGTTKFLGPAGGIRVLRASTKPTQKRVAGQQKGGSRGGAAAGQEVSEADTLHQWQDLQRRFGEAICDAVLDDCEHVMRDAVQVMQDQDRLPALLGDIVTRGVQRVEQQAAAAAAEEEAQLAADRQAMRTWAPRAGSGYGRATGARGPPPPAATSTAYPSLSGGASRGGGRVSPPPPSSSWSRGAPSPTPPQVKLLRNAGSMATIAAESGLNVKDMEALSQLFPGLTPRQVSALLQLAEGNVAAAVDELRAMGVEPGPCMDTAAYAAAMDVFGLADDALDSAAPAPAPAPASPAPVGGVWEERGNEWDAKVAQLLGWFEGMEPEMAEYALRQSGGDVRAAAALLQDSLQALARADDEARSAAMVAQMAALDTGTGASKGGSRGSSSGAAVTALSGGSGSATPVGSTGGRTPERRAGGGNGWQVVDRNGSNGASSRPEPRRPARSAADVQRAKLKLAAGKARQICQLYFDARNVYFQHAAAAHAAGDGKAAADYARKGREYGELAKEYRTVANDESYKMSNWGVQNQFTMDLHGMHVHEAVDMLSQQVDALKRLVVPEGVLLKAITGRGNHSVNKYAAIKAGVLDWLRAHSYKHFIEPGNEGVVVIHIIPQRAY